MRVSECCREITTHALFGCTTLKNKLVNLVYTHLRILLNNYSNISSAQ